MSETNTNVGGTTSSGSTTSSLDSNTNAAINAGTSIILMANSNRQAKKNRKFYAEEAEKQRQAAIEAATVQYNRDLSNRNYNNWYNSAAMQKQRALAAGLNPVTVNMENALSTSAPAPNNASAVVEALKTNTEGIKNTTLSAKDMSELMMAIKQFDLSSRKTNAEIENIEADTEKTKTDTVYQETINKYADEREKLAIDKAVSEIGVNDAQKAQVSANAAILNAQLKYADVKASAEASLLMTQHDIATSDLEAYDWNHMKPVPKSVAISKLKSEGYNFGDSSSVSDSSGESHAWNASFGVSAHKMLGMNVSGGTSESHSSGHGESSGHNEGATWSDSWSESWSDMVYLLYDRKTGGVTVIKAD